MKNHDFEECPYCRVDALEKKTPIWKRNAVAIIISSGVLFGTGLVLQFLTSFENASLVLFVFSAVISGIPIMREGVEGILEKKLDVNILMSIAAVGAFSIGYGAEGAAVLFLYFGAETLEDYAGGRAKKSVSELLKLTPETALLKTEEGNKEVHAHDVDVGDVIIVKPGQRIPLDGKVRKGKTSVNQAPVTGESVSVTKSEKDEVFAGTLNEEGYIEVEVTKPPGKTTLSRIIELVEKAQEKKSETQSLVNRIANYYTPMVILLAALVTIIPVSLFSKPLESWIYKSLVLLAVSCPCAFVLSTPITMVSGITAAAGNGLLIKGSSYIEEINETKALALDKTQTLTEGNPEVKELISLNNSEEEIIGLSMGLEKKSKHPLSKAVIKYGEGKNVEPIEIEEFESIPGEGIIGKRDNKKYYIGDRSFFESKQIDYPKEKVKELESGGKSVIMIGGEKETLGIFVIEDKIRENAPEVISKLKGLEIIPIMLTGDNEKVAKATAEKLGIEKYYAELLPEEKSKKVNELVKKYENVAMLGDGVNDAPALAEANIGIAMGAAGSDVAIETADIVIMENDLSKIVYFWKLGDKTMRRVKENIGISLMVKSALAVLAVVGLITLSAAVGIGDMGISLLVILNALRLGSASFS